MPLYEYFDNALNSVGRTEADREAVFLGSDASVAALAARVRPGARIGIDGWYGVDWPALLSGIQAAVLDTGTALEVVCASDLFLPQQEIAAYQATYETDDPSFGWVNSEGVMEDLMDAGSISALRENAQEGVAGRSDH